ncbi:cell differentiation and development protein fsr1 pro11 [Grosmannia clavigera kw1407]|uniref:Cell differentiation and development protein fsr1 pro11 n=1 Tax=Grosmannia clavigera (strain kw1407 / UAMH 11150) TaxID=655863 RepID=F0X760_GROCL|nr:cell differentiation and development protein fsr1 pro11 [Grosmannia clavigera kw1407]EFX06479.1 cell differentiation and development protein fsr1 pro11 [Grosmannia clavigera kw1407]
MSWGGQNNMGSNAGNGLGNMGGDMSGAQGNGNQPHATEYTLQGVMRFLQTEWHRHERDRNAWEIEKQEMKGRIAALEGSVRRADATQKALNKYVAILQKKVKEQAAQLKSSAPNADPAENAEQPDRAARVLEKLHVEKETVPVEGVPFVPASDDENRRSDLRTFLDQCQAEFAYLMITPANPLPPRESPPLPPTDELREEDYIPMGHQHQQSEQYGQQQMRSSNLRQGQGLASHVPQAPAPPSMSTGYPPGKNVELQPTPMVRSNAETGPSLYATAPPEWTPQTQVSPAPNRSGEDSAAGADLARSGFANNSVMPPNETTGDKPEAPETDAWDFNDGPSSFPEPGAPQHVTTRPDTDLFPTADNASKSPNRLAGSHRRKGSMSRRRNSDHHDLSLNSSSQKVESGSFKLRFGLRGHLDTVRSVIFSGGGSPGEPEICTAGDDGLIKRFHIPRTANYIGTSAASDLDVQADFTHRGHNGAVLCLTSWSPSPNFSTGGRAQGDGWIFSGGQDNFIRVWERGRVDPKATIDGHTDAVWALCVLPATLGSIFGQSNPYGSPDRILLASGAADGSVRVWAISAPPQLTSPAQPAPAAGRRAGGGRVRGNSMSSGSAFPSSPQPTTASSSPFDHTLVHTILRANSKASPTCITALSDNGATFAVSYSDASIIVYDTRLGEEIGSMASLETYNGTMATSVNAVVATTVGLEQPQIGEEDIAGAGGPTGGGRGMAGSGVEGVIISGHEDRFIRFFDANSGQCTYDMLAHPAAISSLSLSPDGRELVSAGHDASLRFWSLEKRTCTQEITSHRIMRGEGVCSVVWSHDARWVVSGGGDGVVKIFAR